MINTRGVCVLALVALVSGCGGHSPSKRGGASTAAPVTSQQTTYALGTARAEHQAILLPTGDVFVVGGVDSQGQVLDSTEIVNAEGVRPGPTLSMPRTGHTLTLLPNGNVLVAGGISSLDGPPTQSTEIFDPEFGDLNPGPELADARAYHTTFYVGEALIVAGGQGASAAVADPFGTTPPASTSGLLDTLERVDVPNRVTEILPIFLSMPQKNLLGVAISPLQFVFVGGQTETGPAPAEIFDGTGLIPLAGLPPRAGAAIATNNNTVVVLSGESEGVLRDDLEVFDGFSFQPQAFGLHPRQGAVAAVSSAGILIVGGVDAVGPSEVVEILLPSQVAQLAPLERPRHAHTFTLGAAQEIGFAIGGYDADRVPMDSIELIQVPGLDFASTLGGGTGNGLNPNGNTPAAGRLEAAVDAQTLAGILRAASGADCNSTAHKASTAKPAAPGIQSARLPAAGTARLAILIADVAEPTDADLLAQPAQPKADELIDRLERALTGLGATNARDLASETRTQLQSLCAIKFPGTDLKSFLKHYTGKAHPAKDLLKARIRIYKGLEAAAAAPALDAIMGQAASADLKSLDDGVLTAQEALAGVRTAIMAPSSAAAADTRAGNAFTVLGQLLEFDALAAPTTLANPATSAIPAP